MRYEILVDRTERPAKCSILPLVYRSDFRVVRFDRRYSIAPLTGNLLLHPDGVELSRPAPGEGRGDEMVLCAVDCTWTRLKGVIGRIRGPLPPLVRIPDGFRTAYRRRNKQDRDPAGGLATIEALFLASAFLGTWDETLLCEYPMAAAFLAVNAPLFEAHGLGPAQGPAGSVTQTEPAPAPAIS